jgi:uncharacterized membrane protein
VSSVEEPGPVTSQSPARDWLVIAILVVTTIGFFDAAYLTYVHYNGLKGLICAGGHNGHSSCLTVQSSQWAKVAGIPVALLGLLGYIGLYVSYYIAAKVDGEIGRALGFGIALIGFGFSMYLTYRELFSIHAICEWCVGSAVCMTLLVVLTATRFLRGDGPSGYAVEPPGAISA